MNIVNLISFLIVACAFTFGAVKIFKKGKPLYFQLLICAAGCYMLEALSMLVNSLCGNFEEAVTIGYLGIFGCNFFLLSANFGQLDRIVDDGSEVNLKAKRIAFIAPVIMLFCAAAVFLSRYKTDLFASIVFTVIFLPAVASSYFNLKHLLMPVDDFGFLRSTRRCNRAALEFYVFSALYLILSSTQIPAAAGIVSIIMSISVLGIVISSVKGAKSWGI